MDAAPPSPARSLAAVIVAAGKGLRAGQDIPKQFAPWRGSTVLRSAVEALVRGGVQQFAVAIPEGADALARDCLRGIEGVRLVTGGATRQESVARSLEALVGDQPALVLVHDAARPDCPPQVIERLVAALADHPGAIPVLPVVDSMVLAKDDMMTAKAEREVLRRVQTPQAFRFADILDAHRSWTGEADAGDDAQVLRAAGGEVALVAGDERLRKLTFAEDFMTDTAPSPPVRVGMGYDVHRLAAGEELWLCGVFVPHDKGLAGHSDADVGLHAVVDAILGAVAKGDIGQHFPPSDPQWKGAASARFVEHAVQLAAQAGYRVGNVDLTLVCEAPKIGPHRDAMRARLAELLGVAQDAVSVKATTTERLGFPGRGEGIAAQAVATMVAM
ncbi:bifunctional 2-C-methyl-D-erythritol 4-phosphate cytidylyltransferase/2-C-methyl-D-erythritol 2,4-cyclodiphosphate synthase [Aurantiacibacter poecillastricola]|uniref:bifunctional 2-C-methyl-D-erythritol 4-phosphate cytidylyltransferase/2-C-methyl-D-erythritol 2,4-cyclodiphosphate synthase n=1 Tax=Aurantiacibacter poecillastricola TaxID=3064385 RepID=UPI00273E2398|nr:bifunctional 2-C-methyl-D-erythritol 4-phosphate cytidylyltransferase/2-C-methyl-D-erythritol 2,4-cyclodiphosphate synthase [Aurantiacibacter sp. 219JJ12-13]MDP5261981.1 bifunctional 2-C-methyl-D-erythritol 4-phosphate cytidylyltransferase/2-C-methyl-D-erythritol 2,4-cyclodiphosphate synthase [Aurantiacibacter sp. 219JJ12-13]